MCISKSKKYDMNAQVLIVMKFNFIQTGIKQA